MKKCLFIFTFLLVVVVMGSISALAAVPTVQGEDLLSGKKIELTTKSKGTVLVFLSARCPCSNSHLKIVDQLAKDFPDFQFVGVHSNIDEKKEMAQEYFKSASLSFPMIEDDGSKLADQYRASKTPHVFVLNPAGEVVYKGGVTNSADAPSANRQYLKEALTEIQAGKAVTTAATRSLGCVISRGGSYVW